MRAPWHGACYPAWSMRLLPLLLLACDPDEPGTKPDTELPADDEPASA